MIRRRYCIVLLLTLLGAVAVPTAYAFECPILHKKAKMQITKARAASQQVADPAKLVAIEELLDQAEDKLNESETTHFGAKNTADHATSVRLAYEATGLAKEAYYLATK